MILSLAAWASRHLSGWMRSAGVLALTLPSLAGLRAADAAFSFDGKLIYCPEYGEKPVLEVLDIDAGKLSTVVPVLSEGSQEIQAVSTAAGKQIWLLTKDRLWLWDGSTNTAKLSGTAAAGSTFDDVACDVRTGSVLITTNNKADDLAVWPHGLLWKKEAAGPMLSVFVRRVARVEYPAFLGDGTFLFGCEGDLWHGQVEDDTDGENKPRGVLNAYRYAPLATRETYVGTPMQTGVANIAVSKGKAYVHVRRMGGSGWGDIVRLNRPPVVAKGTQFKFFFNLKEHAQIYQKALASLEILAGGEGQSFMCGSADLNQVHFTGAMLVENGQPKGRRPHYVVENDKDVEPLKAK